MKFTIETKALKLVFGVIFLLQLNAVFSKEPIAKTVNVLTMNDAKYTERRIYTQGNIWSTTNGQTDLTKVHLFLNGVSFTDYTVPWYLFGSVQFDIAFGVLKPGDVLRYTDDYGSTPAEIIIQDDYVYTEVPNGISYNGNGIDANTDIATPGTIHNTPIQVGKCEPITIGGHVMTDYRIRVNNYDPITTGVFKINGTVYSAIGHTLQGTHIINANGSISVPLNSSGYSNFYTTSINRYSGSIPLEIEYRHNGNTLNGAAELKWGFSGLSFRLFNDKITIEKQPFVGNFEILEIPGNFLSADFKLTYDGTAYVAYINGIEQSRLTRQVKFSSTGGTISNTSILPYGSNVTFTPTQSGLQSVLVTIDYGVYARQYFQVAEDMVLSPTTTNATCNGESTGRIVMNVTGGHAPLQYKIGTNVYSNNNNFTGLASGTYLISVKDASGCEVSRSVTVSQNTLLVPSVISKTNVSCSGDATGSVNLAASGATPPYSYSKDGTNYQTSASFGSLIAGTYTFSAKDALGCTKTVTETISSTSNITASISSQTTVGCAGSSTGSATISTIGSIIVGTLQYSKDGTNFQSSNVFNNLSAGNYTITIKDDLCSKTIPLTISQNTAIAFAPTISKQVLCNTGNTGEITASASGGLAPYTFSKDGVNYQNSTIFSGLIAGNYTINVKDAQGCIATSSTLTLTEPSALNVGMLTKTDILCNAQSNGALSVSASGGTLAYSYSKDGVTFQTSNIFNGLSAGVYSIVLKDNNTCTATTSITINQPNVFTISLLQKQDITCGGANTGVIEVTPTGGTSTYQYSIDNTNFQSSGLFTSLAAGTYTIYAKDFNNCTTTLPNIVINGATPITIALIQKEDVNCETNANGMLKVLATGGGGVFTYTLSGYDLKQNPVSGSNSTGVFANLAVGNYTITAQENGGTCSKTYQAAIVPKNSKIQFAVSKTLPTNCSTNDGTLNVTGLSGGTPPYQFRISTQNSVGTNPSFTSLSNGLYIVTVIDNACSYSQNVDLRLPSSISLTHSLSPIDCSTPNATLAISSTSGGNGTYSYSLDNGTIVSSTTFANVSTGIHTITAKDSPLSCQTVHSFEVKEQNRSDLQLSFKTDISCNGGSNGVIEVTANNNVLPHTFSFNNKNGTYQSSGSFSGLTAGTYKVYAKNGIGCIDSLAVTISQPVALSATLTKVDNLCNGDNTGQITVIAANGTPSYQYSKDGNTFVSSGAFIGLNAGNYTISIRDNKGCILTKATTLSQPTALTITGVTSTPVLCFGGNNGTASLTATGGTGSLSYSIDGTTWVGTSTFTGLSAGTNTLRVKDANNCTASQNITITQPTATILVSTQSKTAVSCSGISDGTINLTAVGGSLPYTYSKDGVTYQASASFTGLAEGSYTFWAKDANNCTNSITETIGFTSKVVASISAKQDILCNGLTNGSATVSTTGSSPVGTLLFSKEGSSFSTNNLFDNLAAGTYSITVKDNVCSTTVALTINQPTVVVPTASTQKNVSCFGGNDGEILVSATGGVSPYTFSKDGTTGSYQSGTTLNGLTSGTYQVFIKDANGCIKTVPNIVITQPTLLSITEASKQNVKCFGGNDGSITVNGSGGVTPYTYQINGGTFQSSNSFASLTQGTYTLSIKDANGCIKSVSITIAQPNAVFEVSLFAKNNLTCFQNNSGSIEVRSTGGTTPYQFSKDNSIFQTSSVFQNLAAGTYTIYAKDINNCVASVTGIVLTESNDITPSLVSKTDVDCAGQKGDIRVTAIGGTGNFTYILRGTDYLGDAIASISNNTGFFSNLEAGNYVVTARDGSSCTKDLPVTISITNTPLTFDPIKTLPTACLANDGAITISNIQGGTAPFQYKISTIAAFGTATNFTSLSSGTYVVMVADARCAYNKTVDLRLPASLNATLTLNPISCAVPNANLTISNTTGGSGNYQYSLDGGAFTAGLQFNNLVPNVHTLTIKDSPLTCQTVLSFEVKEQNRSNLKIDAVQDISCFSGNDGMIRVLGTNNTGPFTYSINGGAFTSSNQFNSLTAGIYILSAKNRIGCVETLNVTITQPTQLAGSLSKVDNSCFGDATGQITATATGGTSPYQYALGTGAYLNTNIFSNLTANTYYVNLKDSKGCTIQRTITVSQPTVLTISTITTTKPLCFGGSTGTLSITAAGGRRPYSYSKDNGVTWVSDSTFAGFAAGTYTVLVKDASNCQTSGSGAVGTNLLLQANIASKTDAICLGNANGSITLGALGGVSPYQYSKDGITFQNTTIFSGLAQGTHSFTIKDANGCLATVSGTIGYQSQLFATGSAQQNVSCFGGNNGSVSINTTGSVPAGAIQFSINNGTTWQTNGTFSNLTAINYTILVKDNLCQVSVPIVISEPSIVLVDAAIISQVLCYGGNSGSIDVTASGGVTPYQYSKDGITYQSSASFTGLAIGTYKFWVKDANGCIKNTNFFTLTQPTDLVPSIASNLAVKCFGGNDGIVGIAAVGGRRPFTYNINGGLFKTDSTFAGLIAGTYTFVVKDANGCTKTIQAIVAQPNRAFTMSVALKKNLTCYQDASGRIEILPDGGTGPYLFSKNNTEFQSSTIFQNLAQGTYTIYGKDANGCTFSNTNIQLTEPNNISTTLLKKTDIDCEYYQKGEFIVNSSGSNGSFSYILNGTDFKNNPIPTISNTSGRFIDMIAGNYTVTSKDITGCTRDFPVSIISKGSLIRFDISKTLPTTCISTDGTINVQNVRGGAGNYSYKISSQPSFSTVSNFSNLRNGTYIVTVSDNLCYYNQNVDLRVPNSINADYSLTPISCQIPTANLNVHTITGGSNSSYQLSLNSGGFSTSRFYNNLAPKVYNLEIKDNPTTCLSNVAIEVKEQNRADLTLTSKNNISCFGGTDGSIATIGNNNLGPFQYAINNGGWVGSGTFNGLKAGNYKISALTTAGCVDSLRIALTEPTLLQGTLTKKENDCFADTTGKITAFGTGGTPPYQYAIKQQNFQKINEFTGLLAGNYTVTIKDSKGCTLDKNTTIIQPTEVLVNPIYQDTVRCFGEANGAVLIKASGGTPTYSYSLDSTNFGGDNLFKNLKMGKYTFFVKDSKQCLKKKSLEVTEPKLLVIDLKSLKDPLCAGDQNGIIEVEAKGGNLGNFYTLDNVLKQPKPIFEKLTQAEYSIRVTDRKGCFADLKPVKLTWPKALTASIEDLIPPRCVGDTNGRIKVLVTGGVAGYESRLSNEVIFNKANDLREIWDTNIFSYNNLISGNYLLQIKDKNACGLTLPITMPMPSKIEKPIFEKQNVVCKGQEVTLNANNPKLDVVWKFKNKAFSNSQIVTVSDTGSYLVTIKNKTGCELIENFELKNSAKALNADFLMPTQAFIGDTIVALDITKPLPNKITWILPDHFNLMSRNNNSISFILNKNGEYKVGMIAEAGDCKNIILKNIKIFERNNVDGTDSAYSYKQEMITKVFVSPNPSNGKFVLSVTLKKPTLKTKLKVNLIYVATGNIVYNKILEPKTLEPDFVHEYLIDLFIVNGIYNLSISTENQQISTRIAIIND